MSKRDIRKEIEIAAPIAAVWKALTDAEELSRWFPLEARVTPGVGGSVWLSWGEGMAGESRIEVWDEGRRLRVVTDTPTAQLAQDFVLETRGGTTVLRLVHSGFGSDADWDGEYNSIDRGWGWFLKQLRHYLERHPGKPRQAIWARTLARASAPDAWARLISERGMNLPASPRPGDRYELGTAGGDRFTGVVLSYQPPYHFGATVENLDDSLLLVEIEPAQGGRVVPSVLLSTFGLAPEVVAGLRARLGVLVDELFRDTLAADDGSPLFNSMTTKEPS